MTIADLKRRLTLGVKIKLISAPFMPNHKFLGVVREVTQVRTRAVKFGTSWVEFPKAQDLQETANGFTILENGQPSLTYEFINE